MKFLETTFEEYITTCRNENLHNDIQKNFEKYPSELENINNMIFYGPPGTGKYTQALSFISKYSPSSLKYEKKICVNFNKCPYYYKISDIHIEIDMSLLGCNAKLLWHEEAHISIFASSARRKNTCCKFRLCSDSCLLAFSSR